MRNVTWTTNAFVTAVLLAAAAGLHFAPAELTAELRVRAADAASPWAHWARSASARVQLAIASWRPPASQPEAAPASDDALAHWKDRCRKLEVEQALLRHKVNELERSAALAIRPVQGQPLFVPDLLEAGIVGQETAGRWRAAAFVDRGAEHGLTEDALVVDAGGLRIDQGQESGVAVDQPVYAGRIVLGKIERVGRWVSSIQPVTHPNYRGMAQLYRRTAEGLVPGPQGLIVGEDGSHCRLTLIAATEAVSPGDEVYTAVSEDVFPYPMYYGSVVKAELEPGALEWNIWVEPAAVDHSGRVMVLRHRINPARAVADSSSAAPPLSTQ